MFQLRSKVLQYGREHLISEGFQEINSPKIIAAAAEGGTNLFPMKYFETDAYLSQSPQLYKQLAVLGGLERVSEIRLPSEPRSTTPTGTSTSLYRSISRAHGWTMRMLWGFRRG